MKNVWPPQLADAWRNGVLPRGGGPLGWEGEGSWQNRARLGVGRMSGLLEGVWRQDVFRGRKKALRQSADLETPVRRR